MPLHILKPALGCTTPHELYDRQEARAHLYEGRAATWAYTTRRSAREAEVLDGGSIYWVMNNHIASRQRFLGFGEGRFDDGRPFIKFILDRQIMLTEPRPYKSFQGWRYLEDGNTPGDIGLFDPTQEAPPEEMAADLKLAGLL